MKIEIKNRWTGSVIFEHAAEVNSWALTIKAAQDAIIDLRDVDLSHVDLRGANLSRADLSGAKVSAELIPTAEQAAPLLAEVAAAALVCDDALDMSTWHTCETTHCIAGWAIQLAGKRGAALEKEYGSQSAGLALLGAEAASHFFDTNEEAREWLRTKVKA